jgi:hypothetical protein
VRNRTSSTGDVTPTDLDRAHAQTWWARPVTVSREQIVRN